MDTTKLFRIGEVAKLYQLSVGSLRHYESAGLLKPEFVDPKTGYRYYGARQFEVLNTIRYLRMLDMPLPEIEDFLKNRDVERIEEKLRQQKKAVEEKQRELQRIQQKIEHRLVQLQEAKTAVPDQIIRLKKPACRIVWMKGSLRPQSFLDMESSIRKLEQSQKEAVVFLGKVGVGISPENLCAGKFGEYDNVFLVLDAEDRFEGEVQRLPEADCIMVRFRGSHPEAPAQYERLMHYMKENRLAPAGFSREITLIDNGFTDNPKRFVTEISIPVKSLSS